MQNAQIPIIGFAAFSGTGKTTLLTQLIPLLAEHKLRTGLIKHSHHNFQIDNPGKDSFRLRAAGASPVLLVSKYRRAMITEFESPAEPNLDEQLKFMFQSDLDLILVEGFKSEKIPKIEIHRPSLQKPFLYPNDPLIIAIATDEKISTPTHIVNLDLNDPKMIAEFILKNFMGLQYAG